MAKSETSTIRVQLALANSVCQLASPHQNDFAISIAFGDRKRDCHFVHESCRVRPAYLDGEAVTPRSNTHIREEGGSPCTRICPTLGQRRSGSPSVPSRSPSRLC